MQSRPEPTTDSSAPRYDRTPSFQLHSDLDNTSTAYHGAAGNGEWNTPLIRLDKSEYDDIELHESTPFSPNTREGFGSRFLSTLATNSPAAAALQRSGSVLHSRAKSWATYVPKLTNSRDASPEKLQRQSKLFGDLFNGDSAPVHLGLPTSPTKEKNEDTEFVMEYTPTFTERPGPRQQRKSSTTSISTNKASKASWFSRKVSSPTAAPPPESKDEIVNLNIQNSLFPHGPADPLSPQAFNDLLLNATSLLQRVQEEYRKKVEYISSVQPEIDAQKEEVEEAETRAAHLKLQLEDIGRQYLELKQVNAEVITQLSIEKMKLTEARDSAKTVRLVRRDTDENESRGADDEYRRRKRGSAGSDSGFESDADTSSVFSAAMEIPVSSRHAHYASGGILSPPHLLSPTDYDPTPTNRFSLFSRSSGLSQQSTACSQRSPRGSGEAAAWATVESLRQENQQLRTQIENMQDSLQGCIDFVGSVHLN